MHMFLYIYARTQEATAALERLLVRLGVEPASLQPPPAAPATLPVLLDGRLVGRVATAVAPRLEAALRRIKAAQLALEQGADAVLTVRGVFVCGVCSVSAHIASAHMLDHIVYTHA